jgi:hypothetical protein
MKSSNLSCWKCGTSLADVLIPFSRLAKCKTCNTDLHVCLMCKFYDATVSNSCAEPVADKVTNKKLKNFCGFFQPDPAAFKRASSTKSDNAKSQLDSLFGLNKEAGATVEASTLSAEEIARQKLEQLFGLKKD